MWILYFLPKKWLSFWIGKLVHLKLPRPLATWSILAFANRYKIRLDEAEKSVSEYQSIGDFFVRRLKPGIRPISESPLVHPADSRISQIGVIQEGQCIQAKGKTYSLEKLCGDQALAKLFQQGLFVTYYLCPTDYHRVHSPVDGEINRAIHIPGHLWPVNAWSTENIEDLFAVNERVVVQMESRLGPCLLIFVGATNVGQIRLRFDPSMVTNICSSPKQGQTQTYTPALPVQKGEELGAFHMGSTVVMVYPKTIATQREDWQDFSGKSVKLGESFL